MIEEDFLSVPLRRKEFSALLPSLFHKRREELKEDAEVSNLKVLSDRLGYVGVSDLMKVFSTWNLLIGPADHPYLSPGRVSSKEYEMNV